MTDAVVAPPEPESVDTFHEEEEPGKEMDTEEKESTVLNFSSLKSRDFVPISEMTESNPGLEPSDMPSLIESQKEEEEAKEMVMVDNDSTVIAFSEMKSTDFRGLDSVGDSPAPTDIADVEPVRQIQFAELQASSDGEDNGEVEMAEIGHNSGLLVDIADMKSTDFPAVSLKTPPSFGSPGLGSPGSYGRTPGMPPTVGAGGTVNGLPDVATPPRSTPAEPLDVKEDEATREPTKMEGLDLLELDIDAK